jgi:hypothetical protein
VTIDQLRELQPARATQADAAVVVRQEPVDFDAFLERLNIEYSHDIHEGRDRYKLDHCPFNAAHGKGEAAIFRGADNVVGFNCFHNSCQDKTWRDVSALVTAKSSQAEVSRCQDG